MGGIRLEKVEIRGLTDQELASQISSVGRSLKQAGAIGMTDRIISLYKELLQERVAEAKRRENPKLLILLLILTLEMIQDKMMVNRREPKGEKPDGRY